MASLLYNKGLEKLMDGTLNYATTSMKLSLHTATYVANKDHATTVDVTNEITGTGYTASGQLLSGQVVTVDNANDLAKFDASDVAWTNSTFTCRAGVLYDEFGTYLIAYFDFGSDKSVSAGTFTVQWNASGIITIAQAA